MKKTPQLVVALLAIALIAAACGSGDDTSLVTAQPTAEGTPVANDGDAPDENTQTQRLWIGPQLVDCVGVAPQQCMLVRTSSDGQAEYFYDSIEGFTHEAGTSYVIDVEVIEIADPPADASSLQYRLIEVVETTTETAADVIDGTSWKLLGFRDGDLFDAVPENVEITIAFAGDQVSGFASCNNYMGTFEVDGATLSFGPMASTRKLCEPTVMAFEDRYLPLLSEVETAEVTFDDRLVLAPATGATLVFAPA